MLTLPEKLATEFKNLCTTSPTWVVRAVSDIGGSSGATWVAAEKERLVFFCRCSTSGDFEMVPYRFDDANAFEVVDDGDFTHLRTTFPDRQVDLKFPLSEHARVLRIQENWKPIAPDADLRAPVELTPMLIFLTTLQALIHADDEVASEEIGWIRERMIDTNALRRAGAWFRDNSIEKLIPIINERLDEAQKNCLHANLVSVAMSDGVYRDNEAEIIDKLRNKIGITQELHDKIYTLLEARYKFGVFDGEDDEYVSPEAVNLACACLLAMARHDDQVHEREEKLVRKIIRQRETINSARTYLEELGLEGLLGLLPGPLTPEQKRFTLLNLIDVALADGIFNTSKEDLLERFRQGLQVAEADFKADFDLSLTFQCLSVFAPEVKADANKDSDSK